MSKVVSLAELQYTGLEDIEFGNVLKGSNDKFNVTKTENTVSVEVTDKDFFSAQTGLSAEEVKKYRDAEMAYTDNLAATASRLAKSVMSNDEYSGIEKVMLTVPGALEKDNYTTAIIRADDGFSIKHAFVRAEFSQGVIKTNNAIRRELSTLLNED